MGAKERRVERDEDNAVGRYRKPCLHLRSAGVPGGCFAPPREAVPSQPNCFPAMKFSTKAVHAGVEPDPSTGAIMTPIFQTSTYVQAAPGDHKGYEYSRTHNPTRTALQQAL